MPFPTVTTPVPIPLPTVTTPVPMPVPTATTSENTEKKLLLIEIYTITNSFCNSHRPLDNASMQTVSFVKTKHCHKLVSAFLSAFILRVEESVRFYAFYEAKHILFKKKR